jgi:Arc/MetJ family transcription regulator
VRTNIEIDDELMDQAMKATGKHTKKETVHEALELLVRLRRQRDALSLRGKLHWEGDIDAMRRDR